MPGEFSGKTTPAGLARRRLHHFFIWAGVLAAAFSAPVSAADGGWAGSRPNVVLIVADDLGYGDLACYGNPGIRTPNLDRMAREGMKFTQFATASPLCSPSRAALMTGRLPIRYGLDRVLSPVARRGIPKSELTLGELFRSAGYATACIGKWHLGRLPKFLPTRNGFDYYFGIPYSNDMSRKSNPHHPLYRWKLVPPLPLMRDEKIIEREPDQDLLTQRYTEEAIRFMRTSHAEGKRFFLYLPHTAPHPPLHASARFRGRSRRGLYGDVVEELDWSTGEILRTVRELGLDETTLVMFTSDNGPWLAKKQDGGSPGLFHEGKGSTWEGGVRVPFIARWPGKIPAGVTSEAFATAMDLLPTFARLAGITLPAGRAYDGVDLSPVLFQNSPGREALLFYWVGHQLRAVRKGPWKLHVITNSPSNHTRATKRRNPPLLFNVLEDPSEAYDVAADHPGLVKELLDLMKEHKKEVFHRRSRF